ncbi:rhodanese-like domain-containing protein [Paenibacillus sp. MMS18-CY102]|uniref:rhodanese-like domain-containing protein n=1 Tax=Paenibacillus sp. MMS18-CY102 TaxID=2682849 RepID=UPI001365F041|nr:rhodanese-like domain-containing protein [Paenibacillus sp. MMS18-CY102]MWC30788.1 rhodanese-like domain-containing protein [Paenibacillus sp. MMS18-CY102]
MDQNLAINIVIVVGMVWFIGKRFAGVKGLRSLNADQLQNEIKSNRNHVLIDVRESSEVKQGYIAGAMHIPLSRLKQRLNEIPSDRSIYLYCRSGMRSKQAARVLSKNGFHELAHLQGGIMAWRGQLKK